MRIGPRIAPAIFGVGLPEAVPEKTIGERADPRDSDGDGISGRPNRAIDARSGQLVLGRFGWKANVPTVEQQNASAFNGDIGITTPIFPKENCSDVAALSEQTIRPYTDMLLHDMGPGLADGRPDSLASGSEWHTAPLWGIGLVKTVNRHTRFLHDGRAQSIEEAILWHGGEAAATMQRFRKLARREREELLAFLRSL